MNENSCYFYRQPPTLNIQMRHYLFPNSKDLYLWFLGSSQLLLRWLNTVSARSAVLCKSQQGFSLAKQTVKYV